MKWPYGILFAGIFSSSLLAQDTPENLSTTVPGIKLSGLSSILQFYTGIRAQLQTKCNNRHRWRYSIKSCNSSKFFAYSGFRRYQTMKRKGDWQWYVQLRYNL